MTQVCANSTAAVPSKEEGFFEERERERERERGRSAFRLSGPYLVMSYENLVASTEVQRRSIGIALAGGTPT